MPDPSRACVELGFALGHGASMIPVLMLIYPIFCELLSWMVLRACGNLSSVKK